jgi:hypothetical protein
MIRDVRLVGSDPEDEHVETEGYCPDHDQRGHQVLGVLPSDHLGDDREDGEQRRKDESTSGAYPCATSSKSPSIASNPKKITEVPIAARLERRAPIAPIAGRTRRSRFFVSIESELAQECSPGIPLPTAGAGC